jgi:hypothetical protein
MIYNLPEGAPECGAPHPIHGECKREQDHPGAHITSNIRGVFMWFPDDTPTTLEADHVQSDS